MQRHRQCVSSTYRAIFFDLDGTLTDPAEGITRSIQHALERLGATVPPAVALHDWIGPPLRGSFATYLDTQDAATIEQAMVFYRERFATLGLFENVPYAGIPQLLSDLQAAGVCLFLATSKPLPYAQRILEHFALTHYFTAIGGATLDGRISEKAHIIGDLIPQLSPVERAACVMVGDREHDILGARAHGMPGIAVTYGYGAISELVDCMPDRLVGSVAELRSVLVHNNRPRSHEEST